MPDRRPYRPGDMQSRGPLGVPYAVDRGTKGWEGIVPFEGLLKRMFGRGGPQSGSGEWNTGRTVPGHPSARFGGRIPIRKREQWSMPDDEWRGSPGAGGPTGVLPFLSSIGYDVTESPDDINLKKAYADFMVQGEPGGKHTIDPGLMNALMMLEPTQGNRSMPALGGRQNPNLPPNYSRWGRAASDPNWSDPGYVGTLSAEEFDSLRKNKFRKIGRTGPDPYMRRR